MRTKKRNNPATLYFHRKRIEAFIKSCVEPKHGEKISVERLMVEYTIWLDLHGMGKFTLSLDSFGRLLPKTLSRTPVTISGNTSRYCLNVQFTKMWNNSTCQS